MKRKQAWRWVLAAMLLAMGGTTVLAQGALTPPGAPAPTMKTLSQIEPRTAITSAPFTINASGSYYLTANLSGRVTIAANDVSLDLMGFSITSTQSSAIIFSGGSRQNVRVHNGVVSAPGGYGFDFSASDAQANGLIEGVRVRNCLNSGIAVGSGFEVRQCEITGAGGAGISAFGSSIIRNNRVTVCGKGLHFSGTRALADDNLVFDNIDNYDFSAGNELNLLLSHIPESLDWPCSVKLAGSLTTAQTGVNGITVNADDVSIDLAGHTLRGPGANSGHGIYQAGIRRSLSVNNGKVVNWSGTAKSGVYASGRNARMQHLQIVANDNGVTVTGIGATISDCAINGNASSGVYLNGTPGTCTGNTIANCTISGNGYRGVYIDAEFGSCIGNTIANCTISGNLASGVYLNSNAGVCDGNTIANCTISDNGGGISLQGQYPGACVGNTIADCRISDNEYGVNLITTSGNTVTGCTISRNGSVGIHLQYDADANRVEGNHISNTTGSPSYGIKSYGARNLIVRNSCEGQTINFSMNSADTYGPLVTSSGVLPTTGAGAHPWANFSR